MANSNITKKALAQSLKELGSTKILDKITVADITNHCGVNRQTFYYHFQDITALLEHILNADVERVLSQHLDMDSWEDGFISAARFALENKRLVYHIYNSVSRERVERYLYSIAGEVMRLYVSRITEQVEHVAHKKVFPEDQKMVVDFYKFALVGMILDWLNTGMKKDPEGLIRRVGEIFHGNIEAALTRVSR